MASVVFKPELRCQQCSGSCQDDRYGRLAYVVGGEYLCVTCWKFLHSGSVGERAIDRAWDRANTPHYLITTSCPS